MKRPLPALLPSLLSLLSLSCASSPPTRPEPPALSPAAPAAASAPVSAASSAGAGAASAEPPRAPPSPCDRLLGPHREAMARVSAARVPADQALGSFGACTPTPHGAWAVVLDEVMVKPATESTAAVVTAKWAVAHIDQEGRVARVQKGEDDWSEIASRELTHTSAFDHDGDGEPELVVATLWHGIETASRPEGEVYTFRDGKVVPYAPAAGLEPFEARDVDGDGRPDLLTRLPYQAEGDDSPSGFTYNMQGPVLVAHALPDGKFSRDDKAAKDFAKKACPARAARVFGKTIGGLDEAEVAVACALLWGVPPATVKSEVKARCASPDESGTGNPKRPHCGDARTLARWAEAPRPLGL